MRTEVIRTIQLLENLHIRHKKIDTLDANELIREFLKCLDPHFTILTQEDVHQLQKEFAESLLLLLTAGSLRPVFAMFEYYRQKAIVFVNWFLQALSKSSISPSIILQDTNETFTPDRKDLGWPVDDASREALWDKKLRYDLLMEALSYEPNDASSDEKKEKPSPAKSSGKQEKKPIVTLEHISKYFGKTVIKLREHYEHIYNVVPKIDEVEVEELFLNTLCQLYDPHTQFFSVDSMEDFFIILHNSLVGIGAVLCDDNGYCTVTQLLPGGPAERCRKIHPGDKIIAVGQGDAKPIPIADMKLRHSVKLIRGKKGSKVTLVVQPIDGNPSDRKKIVLVRDEIKLTDNLASGELFPFQGSGHRKKRQSMHKIGYIDLPTFYGDDTSKAPHNTTKDVQKLIAELKRKGMEILILDLRRNGGGLLSEAVGLTSLFLENCPVVQVKDSSGKVEVYFSKTKEVVWYGPMVILVSRFSASASEIFAGALQNHRRAVIVGDACTHGKGSVQALVELDDLSILTPKTHYLGAIKVTTQKWYLPNGNSIQKKGVVPDIILPSFNTVLPIGESVLPNALEDDAIEPIQWINGNKKYVACTDVKGLNANSLSRQKELEEFQVSNEAIKFLTEKNKRKDFPLNPTKCIEEQKENDAKLTDITNKTKAIAGNRYLSQKILLIPEDTKAMTETNEQEENNDIDVIKQEGVRIANDMAERLLKESN